MRHDKATALALRKEGKSYNEIHDILGIPTSTLSGWFAKDIASQLISKNLAIKARRENGRKLAEFMKNKWSAYRLLAIAEAKSEFEDLFSDPLFVAGLMLYWGEGDKMHRGHLRITNTDPKMITIFVLFLERIMKIQTNKIRVELLLYPDLSDSDCRTFWMQATNLPAENFMKSQYIVGRHPTKRLSHGICIIHVCSIYQKMKILTWIDIFAEQYIMTQYTKAGIV